VEEGIAKFVEWYKDYYRIGEAAKRPAKGAVT
jgi:hypothetical protein